MFELEDYTFLNPRLFQLKRENYKTINNNGFEKDFKSMAKQIKIELVDLGQVKPSDTTYVRIRISNKNLEKIPSNLNEKIYVSYHWYKDNKIYQWDGLRTPLEVDVYGNYEQDIEVAIPKVAGNYEFVPDIVLEDKGWFMLADRYSLKVID
jgi:hypothetical protein